MTNTRAEIIKKLVQHRQELEKLGVKSLALFGSAARDQLTPDSDIDVLIDFNRQLGFEFFNIGDYLEQLLERQTDVCTEQSLHWFVKKKVLREKVDVFQ